MTGTRRDLDVDDLEDRRALTHCGVLPVAEGMPERTAAEPLIEWLIRCWEQAALSLRGSSLKRALRLMATLKALDPRRCELVEWEPDSAATDAPRLLFAPLGIPQHETLGIASSRLRRTLEFEQAWLGALRKCVAAARDRQQVVVTVEGTAADHCVRRCGRVLNVPVMRLQIGKPREAALWFESALHDFVTGAVIANEHAVFVSPPLRRSVNCEPQTPDSPLAPERDLLLLSLADEVAALSVRAQGHCSRLLNERLRALAQPRVIVVCDDRLTKTDLQLELQSAGAVLRVVGQHSEAASTNCAVDAMSETEQCSLPDALDAYLTHWTRGLESLALRDMPDELLDEWLAQPTALDRTAAASLQRLIVSGRIIARRLTATDSVPVVCFSATPLPELLRHRTYRPHRTRWDAEPFGLCIKRDALQRLGARPVIYGDEAVRNALAPEERHLFQPLTSQTQTGKIDWSNEREWRLPGDLKLEWLDPNDVFVFVRTPLDAERIKLVCNWPVHVVGSIETEACATPASDKRAES